MPSLSILCHLISGEEDLCQFIGGEGEDDQPRGGSTYLDRSLPDDAADCQNFNLGCSSWGKCSVCGVDVVSLSVLRTPYDHTCQLLGSRPTRQSPCIKWGSELRCPRINNFSFCYCYLNHAGSSPNPAHPCTVIVVEMITKNYKVSNSIKPLSNVIPSSAVLYSFVEDMAVSTGSPLRVRLIDSSSREYHTK